MIRLFVLVPIAALLACWPQSSDLEIPPQERRQVEVAIQDREEVRARHPELFAELTQILFAADPIGINFEHNSDEYEPEVGTIIPRLPSCASLGCVQNVVHEEFVAWFGSDIAGPESNYTEVAEEVWSAWQRHDR